MNVSERGIRSTLIGVAVLVGATRIGTISLASSTTHYRSLILLPAFSYRTGTVRIEVISSGKPVQLDGLRLLLTPFPQEEFNPTDDRKSQDPSLGVTCLDCHVNGHTTGQFHLNPDER